MFVLFGFGDACLCFFLHEHMVYLGHSNLFHDTISYCFVFTAMDVYY